MADGAAAPGRRRFKLRPWLRALHRDLGYLAVGLTLVYAVSGLAVNHLADWDPNFANVEREFDVALPGDIFLEDEMTVGQLAQLLLRAVPAATA